MDADLVLERKLGYEFSDRALLKLALTHRSRGSNSYERLEFLGDSILGFVVADWLYQNFPDLAEGKLSRMRASLVRRETLAQIARELDLSNFLIMGEGEMKSGGFNRDSILSDTVESLIGSIYLDGGFAQAEQFIFSKFAAVMAAVSEQGTFKDAKSLLQEKMQKSGLLLPQYILLDTSGVQHEQEFTVQCTLLDKQVEAQSNANTRRAAEQKSAQLVLDKLRLLDNLNANETAVKQ
jgi:ribonuclease-3